MSAASLAVRIGTRASQLAMWQANHTATALRRLGVTVSIVKLSTTGDQSQAPIESAGSEGVFTKRIQEALLAGEVDLAVHSLKDLPTTPIEGIVLAAVPQRHQPADVLASVTGDTLSTLPAGARIGSGSTRRRAQVLNARPDVTVDGIRGNVETRLSKLEAGDFDALVLAAAGLFRLGFEEWVSEQFSPTKFLPAVGQGALGIECRADDAEVFAQLQSINDRNSRAGVEAERAMLAQLRGGCLAPIGGFGRLERGKLRLTGVVLSADGQTRLHAEAAGDMDDPIALGELVAQKLISQGADKLLDDAR